MLKSKAIQLKLLDVNINYQISYLVLVADILTTWYTNKSEVFTFITNLFFSSSYVVGFLDIAYLKVMAPVGRPK